MPAAILGDAGMLTGVRFAVTHSVDGRLVETGESFVLPADMVLKAIGQSFVADPVAEPAASALELEGGRIRVDAAGRTSHAKVWAGGDCCPGGLDLTVDAVAQGQSAALSIDAELRAGA